MANDEERYKIVEDMGVVVDTHTGKKYDFESTVKLLNDTEKFRAYNKEQRKIFENVVYDMTDVIDGFIKLEKLKREGWI